MDPDKGWLKTQQKPPRFWRFPFWGVQEGCGASRQEQSLGGCWAGVWGPRRAAHLVELVGFGERLADVQVRIPGGLPQGVVDIAGHRLCSD